ncbi:MAG: ribbon-helix-helix domain-containing protein [Acidobacteriota bacterium]
MPWNRESKVTIKIPRPLYRKLQQIIEGSGFDSVTDFVVYVLRDLVSAHEVGAPGPESETFTAQDLEKVRKRLKGLGYL